MKSFESSKIYQNPNGCLQEAARLMEMHGGKGQIYYIAYPPEIGYKVMHAYYVPEKSIDTDLALNQEDNGFGQYPKLTVKQVMDYGFQIPANISATKLHSLIQDKW